MTTSDIALGATVALAGLALVACLGPPEYPGANPTWEGRTSSDADGASGRETSTTGSPAEPAGRVDATATATGASADGSSDTSGTTAETSSSPTVLLLAAFGDYGTDNAASADVAALVASWQPDHVFTLGDNNYPVGAAAVIDQHIGQYYAEFIGGYRGEYGPGAVENRFWPSPGNHDWLSPGLQPYLDYFTLPGNERYYDVDLGLVHLFAVDSDPHEPDGHTADSVQAQWLEQALAASDACWKLVYFHHPPYSSGAHGSDEDLQWPFEAWGADAVFAGHDHTYERIHVGGIPYFVAGLGGAGWYSFGATPVRGSQVRYNGGYGAMSIAVSLTDITYEFVDTDGEVIDTHSVDKRCGG